MRRTRRLRTAYAGIAVLLVALTGCSGSEDKKPDAAPTTRPTKTTRTTEPTRNLLDWQPAKGGDAGTVVASSDWVATIDPDGQFVQLDADRGAGKSLTIPAADGWLVSKVLLGEAFAAVVQQDRLEQRPQKATVIDLSDSTKSHEVTDPQPATGGEWALAGNDLYYATMDKDRYCLATFDIGKESGSVTWCARKRHGFTSVNTSPAGVALQTFDAHRPVSCRTLVTVAATGRLTPLAGVPDCKGWEAAAAHDGAVWSTIANERRIELADYAASADGQVFQLGPGVTGSLTWCGDSAYFVRDSQKGGKAQLLRWTPEHTLEIVYESPGSGEAFLQTPRCGGSVLTLSAYGEGGDEQVSATVPG
jgi:hypothetical protein